MLVHVPLAHALDTNGSGDAEKASPHVVFNRLRSTQIFLCMGYF